MEYKERIEKLNSLERFINGEHQDDILLMLDKKYPKDKWSILCAVMHWFGVVIPYLDSSDILKNYTPDNNWGNVYLYISAVDIVTKGINDLYKFITGDDNHIFKGDNDVFCADEDDNDYFQNIRAIFGAHPTDLKGNGDYIVSTYPTPYDKRIGALMGEVKDWDYYTLLWSRKKSDTLEQLPFGFSFKKVDSYLDKNISYLDDFYTEILNKIKSFKEEISTKPIPLVDDNIEQLNIIKKKNIERLNGRYNYEIDILIKLMDVKITDCFNVKIYSTFRKEIEIIIPKLLDAVQHPDKYPDIDFVNSLIDVDNTDFDLYQYSKLMEFECNEDLTSYLINYFKDKITPFNGNVESLKELYCLVKACNYFKSKEEI